MKTLGASKDIDDFIRSLEPLSKGISTRVVIWVVNDVEPIYLRGFREQIPAYRDISSQNFEKTWLPRPSHCVHALDRNFDGLYINKQGFAPEIPWGGLVRHR